MYYKYDIQKVYDSHLVLSWKLIFIIYDSVSISDYAASKCRMINEYWTKKDVKRYSCDLIKVLAWYVPWGTG